MGEITEKRKRHYTGLDADKASIPAGGKEAGDTYFATDKLKQYYWQGGAWKTGLGYEYVPVSKAAWDWAVGDLVINGVLQTDGLDCGAKGVPAGAVAVHLVVKIKDNATAQEFFIQTSAASNVNIIDLFTQVANVETIQHGILKLDADRLLDYLGVAGIDAIYIAILGYWI